MRVLNVNPVNDIHSRQNGFDWGEFLLGERGENILHTAFIKSHTTIVNFFWFAAVG